jgi:hypothetical protein
VPGHALCDFELAAVGQVVPRGGVSVNDVFRVRASMTLQRQTCSVNHKQFGALLLLRPKLQGWFAKVARRTEVAHVEDLNSLPGWANC